MYQDVRRRTGTPEYAMRQVLVKSARAARSGRRIPRWARLRAAAEPWAAAPGPGVDRPGASRRATARPVRGGRSRVSDGPRAGRAPSGMVSSRGWPGSPSSTRVGASRRRA